MATIKVTDLNKQFWHRQVLADINVQFQAHRIYGLLGRNGVGKSTLLNIVTDRTFASSGAITLDDQPIHNNGAALSKMFMVSETNLLPDSTKVSKVVKTVNQLNPGFNMELAQQLLGRFGVNLKTRFGKLSTGYHSILKFIIAICAPADFIILDEPTLGLDANHRNLVYDTLLEQFAATDKTFIVSTHLIDEVASIVSDVVILDAGRVLAAETTEALLQTAHQITGPADELDQYCAGLNVIGTAALGALKTNYVYGPLNDDRRLPDTVKISGVDLQTLFIQLTNHHKGDD